MFSGLLWPTLITKGIFRDPDKFRHVGRGRLARHIVAMEKFRRISFVRSFLLAHRTHLFRVSPLSPNETQIFELTTQRLKITSGVFTKITDTLELYRVKDIETRQPFLSRLVGVENVQMNTSDTSSPFVFIEAVPSSVGLADKLRNQVEFIRQQKRVREIDIE